MTMETAKSIQSDIDSNQKAIETSKRVIANCEKKIVELKLKKEKIDQANRNYGFPHCQKCRKDMWCVFCVAKSLEASILIPITTTMCHLSFCDEIATKDFDGDFDGIIYLCDDHAQEYYSGDNHFDFILDYIEKKESD